MVKESTATVFPAPDDSPNNNLTRGKASTRTAHRGSVNSHMHLSPVISSAKMRRSKGHHSTNDLLGSSSKSKLSLSAGYGGPAPEGPDGKPLKGCLSSHNLTALNDTDPAWCSSSSSSSVSYSPSSRFKRNVSFHRIEVREYERTLGDHPCSDGVPLSLGWRYSESNLEALDEYEKKRGSLRRTAEEMRAPRHVRMTLLKEHDSDLSNKDIQKNAKQVLETKRNRALSNNESTQRNYAAERIQRRVKTILGHGKHKNKPSSSIHQDPSKERAHQAAVQQYIDHASSFSTTPSNNNTVTIAKREEPIVHSTTMQIHVSSPSHDKKASPTWGDHHHDDDDDDALSF